MTEAQMFNSCKRRLTLEIWVSATILAVYALKSLVLLTTSWVSVLAVFVFWVGDYILVSRFHELSNRRLSI